MNTIYNETFTCKDIDTAFLHWYKAMTKGYKKEKSKCSSSRDGNVIGEVINAVTVITDPTKNIMRNTVRDLSIRYAIGEMLWYMSGSTKLKEIQKYTSGWDRMSDDGENVNSNYGYCIKEKFGFDQWDYVKDLLEHSPETRQAVIHIKDADNRYSKDVNCTVCLQFLIRDNKLHLTTYMRSNDIWMGFPYDVFQFTNMLILMSMELGIEVGTYTHICGSLHLYERNYVEADL